MTLDDARSLRQLGYTFLGAAAVLGGFPLVAGTWRTLDAAMAPISLALLGLLATAVAQLAIRRARRDPSTEESECP